MFRDCPNHKDTDGTPMKGIIEVDGYEYCFICVRDVIRENKNLRLQNQVLMMSQRPGVVHVITAKGGP